MSGHTSGIFDIGIAPAGQLSGWNWYSGGAEKGLQTRGSFGEMLLYSPVIFPSQKERLNQ